MRYDFASDNTAGLVPAASAAMVAAGDGAAASYGEDRWTQQAADAVRRLFETDCDVYFVFNGTAANSLALATMCQPYHSVVAHRVAHIETDECGAPEFFSGGATLSLVDGADGRVAVDELVAAATRRRDLHFPKAKALSLTQSTELGTVYRPESVTALSDAARSLGMRTHMDGARFANAVATLGCTPAAVTWQAGVDVLSLGGTKNGMSLGEAVIFFDRSLSEEFSFRCKQAGQLASKMRYFTAPWATMLDDGLWLEHAAHANAMATHLAGALTGRGVTLAHPVEANAVFARLDDGQRRRLTDAGWVAYDFIGGATRFVCSWSTEPATIDELIADLSG
jgi:threonine aldolase